MTPRPSDWRRGRWFAVLAGSTLAATAAATLVFAATEGQETELHASGIALIVWTLAGLPIVLAVAARLLGAPGRAVSVGAVAFTADIIMVLLLGADLVPAVQDGPRLLFNGTARGSVEEVSARPEVAWAEITPATVWTARVGTGVMTSMDKDGHIRTHSTSASPIVPSLPYDGQTSLFACDDADDLADIDPGTGVIAGRVTPAGGTAADAIRELAGKGVRVGPSPRCVTPTLGDATTTLALGLTAAILYILAIAIAGGWALYRAGLGR